MNIQINLTFRTSTSSFAVKNDAAIPENYQLS